MSHSDYLDVIDRITKEREEARAENRRLRAILVRAWDGHMAAFEVYEEEDENYLLELLKDEL
jgi:hypothetical protein